VPKSYRVAGLFPLGYSSVQRVDGDSLTVFTLLSRCSSKQQRLLARAPKATKCIAIALRSLVRYLKELQMRSRGWQRFVFCCCHEFPVVPTVLLIAFTGAGENSCSDRCFGHLWLCMQWTPIFISLPPRGAMSRKSLLRLHTEQRHSPCKSQGLGDTKEPGTPEKPVSVATESQLAARQQSEPHAGPFRALGCLSAKVNISSCCCCPGCSVAQSPLRQRFSSIW